MEVDHDHSDRDDPEADHPLLSVFTELDELDEPERVEGTEGEVIYFKKPYVAMLSVDLAAVEPELIDGWEDDDDDHFDEAA